MIQPVQVEDVRLTIEIDLDQLPEPKAVELGRILRYWVERRLAA